MTNQAKTDENRDKRKERRELQLPPGVLVGDSIMAEPRRTSRGGERK